MELPDGVLLTVPCGAVGQGGSCNIRGRVNNTGSLYCLPPMEEHEALIGPPVEFVADIAAFRKHVCVRLKHDEANLENIR